jgi:hypothetical protein
MEREARDLVKYVGLEVKYMGLEVKYMEFQVLRAVRVQIMTFCDVTPYSRIGGY